MTICYVPPLFSSILLKVESEIWEAKSGFFWDHFGTLVPFGTKSQNWDLFGAPEQRWTENPSQYYSYNNSNRSLLLLEALKYLPK